MGEIIRSLSPFRVTSWWTIVTVFNTLHFHQNYRINITLGWKGFPVTNTLAYCVHSVSPPRKSIANTAPGACIIKLITTVIYGYSNTLECLYLASLSSLVYCLWENTLAYYGIHILQPYEVL